jgi:hypothetical protein
VRRSILLVVLTAALLAGCASPPAAQAPSFEAASVAPPAVLPPTPLPTPTPTPSPTPVPKATPTPGPTDAELAAACKGAPVPAAAKYGGAVHSLIVANETSGKWIADPSAYLFNSPNQLVVCIHESRSEKVGSCGTYRRRSDGVVGEVNLYKYTQKVRVIVAKTGKLLQSRTFVGNTPTCTDAISISGLLGQISPPWFLFGDVVSADVIDKYVTAVTTQKVK